LHTENGTRVTYKKYSPKNILGTGKLRENARGVNTRRGRKREKVKGMREKHREVERESN